MERLRIMSSNLLQDRARPESLAAAIEDLDPDVLVVQELGPRCAAVIEDAFTHCHLEERPNDLGVGIASRRPINARLLEMPERSAWITQLDPTHWRNLHAPLTIIGLHATNPIDWPWADSVRRRREQFRLVAEATAGIEGPYVVIGDMNSTPVWPGYRRLAALGDDAARVAGTRQRTWSYFTTGPRLLRIDHAFVSGVEVTSTSTRSIQGTDHDALIVDLAV